MSWIKNKPLAILLCLYLSFVLNSLGQDAKKDTIYAPPKINENNINQLESIIENLESEDGEFDNNTFLEDLEYLKEKKININVANKDDLRSIDMLNEFQINGIQNYIEAYGPMQSIYELNGILELDKEEIQYLSDYLYIDDNNSYQYNSLKDRLKNGKHTIFLLYQQVLEQQAGYEDRDPESTSQSKYYEGIKPKLYARYRYQHSNDLSYGITLEKDAGEQLFSKGITFTDANGQVLSNSYRGGIDYISGHLFLKNRNLLKAIAIGDYEVKLGEGLVVWQGYSVGKTANDINIKRRGFPIKPHTSANEINYFRGAAFTLDLPANFELTAFGSFKKIDGNQIFNNDEEDPLNDVLSDEITSVQTSGYHRTIGELLDKNAINQSSAGGNLKWVGKMASVGVNAMYNHISTPLGTSDEPYKKFFFSGQDLINASINYSVLKNNAHFFGETALSSSDKTKGIATLNGVMFKASGADISILHRYFDKRHQILYTDIANAFAEGSRPQNEHGLYVGISFSPFKNAVLNGYIDLYKRPWLAYRADAPSNGLETLAQLTFKPNRKIEAYARGKFEIKETNAANNTTELDFLVPSKRTNVRLHTTYKLNAEFSLRSRIEFAFFNDGVNDWEKGILLYQDLTYRHPSEKFTATGRFALFQTDTYDARIYAYENDVLYAYSVPPYYGRGARYYLLFKWSITRHMDFWLRFAQTYFNDRETISSGANEIDGNTRSDIKVQVRFKF